jgi:hypothetical protein
LEVARPRSTDVYLVLAHGIGSDASRAAFVFGFRFMTRLPNKRLKLAARVDYGMNFSSARRSLSAVR